MIFLFRGITRYGAEKEVRLSRDGDGANWETNPYAINIEEKSMTRETALELKLTAGGGQAFGFAAKDWYPRKKRVKF